MMIENRLSLKQCLHGNIFSHFLQMMLQKQNRPLLWVGMVLLAKHLRCKRKNNEAMNGNLQAQKLGLNLSYSRGAEHIVSFQL